MDLQFLGLRRLRIKLLKDVSVNLVEIKVEGLNWCFVFVSAE
jgi:hypothetical protein